MHQRKWCDTDVDVYAHGLRKEKAYAYKNNRYELGAGY